MSSPSRNGFFGNRRSSSDTGDYVRSYPLELLRELEKELENASRTNRLEEVTKAVRSLLDSKRNGLSPRMPFIPAPVRDMLENGLSRATQLLYGSQNTFDGPRLGL